MSKIPISNRVYACKECASDYSPQAGNQLFCSEKCKKQNRLNRLQIKTISRDCSNGSCGKQFFVSLNSDPKKYCSSSCAAHINNQSVPKRKLEGKCKTCRIPIPSSLSYCDTHKIAGSYEPRLTKKRCASADCNNIFQTTYKSRKYCSTDCKNISNASTIATDSTRSIVCPECGEKKSKLALTCQNCTKDFYANVRIKSWLKGDWTGGSEHSLSAAVRKYVLEQAEYKCRVCGWDEVHPDDGKPILEVNHIDGNGSNHRPENLEVLCPNHHAMTSSYRGRNIGNGRKFYYVRVQK